jgi:hypothetical protein
MFEGELTCEQTLEDLARLFGPYLEEEVRDEDAA